MGRIRGKNTTPEMELRKRVWALGGRFRCHPASVPGRPDMVNVRARVAVFVDGCFWHGCRDHYRPPKTRTAFWNEKIRRNQGTRARVLKSLGKDWKVFEVYECKLKADPDGWAGRVSTALRRGRR